VKLRTTQEQRDALRQFIVDRVIAHDGPLANLPDGDRWQEVAQVLIDCNEAIYRVESMENRLSNALDGITSAQGYVSSLLTDVRR
jgi:hypothetical protein